MKKLLTLALLILSLGTFAQEKVALVIGNADYKVSALKNALNDAQDIAIALEDLDFKVTLIENADRRAMRDAVYNFGKKLNKDSVGLFYYAGHAVQHLGENYLIPINAMSSIKELRHLEDEAVRLGYVSNEISARQSQLNFIFLDACRDNPLPAESRGITQGLAKSQNAEGTLIAYSTSPGRTAEDGIGRNSPYTKNLLKFINTPNQPIELMLKEVKTAVSNDTNGDQLPWYESSITGNFCFKTTNDSCAEAVITIIDNPYFEGLYDLEAINLDNGDNYIGQVKDEKFNGKGILTYKTGAKYQGEFINGKRHGEGTITQLNGNRFEGNFINDMRHGKGTLSWVSGSSIETEWDLGKRVYPKNSTYLSIDGDIWTKGYGTYKGIDNSHYEGEFQNGYITGQGIFTKFNGMRYEGQFIKGFLNGDGIRVEVTGDYIEAQFIDNLPHGFGKYFFSDGGYYEGEFNNGYITGQGTLIYFDGSKFKGSFQAGLAHGQNEAWYADGAHFIGEVSFSKLVSGKYTWRNGDSWEGPMKNLMKHGYGIYRFNPLIGGGSIEGDFINNFPGGHCISTESDGTVYQGECKMAYNGVYNGQGKIVWPNGESFEGEFKGDKPNGKGILYLKDGLTRKGNFKDGKMIGEFYATQPNGETFIEYY